MELSAFDVLMVPIFWGTLLGLAAGWAFLTLMNAVERLVLFIVRLRRSTRTRAGSVRGARRRVARAARRGAYPQAYV
jgi:hypothetical protein